MLCFWVSLSTNPAVGRLIIHILLMFLHLVPTCTDKAALQQSNGAVAYIRKPWLSKDKSITGNDIMSPVCPGDRSKNISQEERRATVPEPIVPKSFGCFRRTDMDTDSGMCSTQLPPIQ